ncbi:carboxymuconolactone decarboxylase family protein [Nitrosomonas sp. Nm51]|uniref:carboxymuconolactone decarboxylase family protein n=1 Tax=Nitrosomonas sp. Nm51 TaxID=133720 RepID=UPI0015A6E3F6|nr:peroxidase-related enzyme [Nitrosomonas sp. Nm51]
MEIEKTFGSHTHNVFKVYAEHPPLLATNWEKYKAIMLQGKLRRKVRETIAILISQDNGCKYCVAAHRTALHSMKISDSEISAVSDGMLPDDFTDKEAVLVKFARKANSNWHDIENVDLQTLSDLGVEKSEMLKALGTMEFFIVFNRCADVLGIEIDF